MCGFIALVNYNKIPVKIGRLLDKIDHRGPDGRGWAAIDVNHLQLGKADSTLNSRIVLGHVRLSIIDLSDAGHQPMHSEDKRYSLVFNGEIYNYIELRDQLISVGYIFNSGTDTEVVLHALTHWGEDALKRFRGMFSFVYYDAIEDSLIIARDFFGIKPFYWCRWDGGLAFASESGPLLDLVGVSNSSALQETYDYLINGSSDTGEQSMYRDLHFLPAASYAKINCRSNQDIQILPIKYWDISLSNKIHVSFEEAVIKVRELFLKSVSLHMRSDVAVGAALSGGIDSSSIVCAIRHLYPDLEIHTFSFIADEEAICEESWVDLVNSFAKCTPHKVSANTNELLTDLDDLIKTQGEPFGSTSIYAQYRVFKEAQKNGIKVILDGQGADELLGGYSYYQAGRLASMLSSFRLIAAYKFLKAASKKPNYNLIYTLIMAIREILPEFLRIIATKILFKEMKPKWISDRWFAKNTIRHKRHNIFKNERTPDYLRAMLYDTLFFSSVPHLLRYEDRNSMRFSIESRVPFLHVDLVEYLYSLPEEYLISEDGRTKYVFREAMRGIVPDEILDRHDKIGFATPEKDWLTNLNVWVSELFSYAHRVKCFNQPEMVKEWLLVKESKKEFNFRYWRWFNFLAWEKAKARKI